MESILNDIMLLIEDATGYLKMFVAGATGFFVLKDCIMFFQKFAYSFEVVHLLAFNCS